MISNKCPLDSNQSCQQLLSLALLALIAQGWLYSQNVKQPLDGLPLDFMFPPGPFGDAFEFHPSSGQNCNLVYEPTRSRTAFPPAC